MKIPNKILSTIIIAQFVKIWDKNLNYIGKTYDIFNDKIWYFLDLYCIIVIKQSKFHAIFSLILTDQTKDYFVYNVNWNITFAEMYTKIKTKGYTKVNKA